MTRCTRALASLGEHPRGLAFQAATKSEALAGIAAKVRQKIEEAQDVVEG